MISPRDGAVYSIGSHVPLVAVASTPTKKKIDRVSFSANGRSIRNADLYAVVLPSVSSR